MSEGWSQWLSVFSDRVAEEVLSDEVAFGGDIIKQDVQLTR